VPTPRVPASFTSPIVDYEPPATPAADAACRTPSALTLRRHTPRPLRHTRPPAQETPLPPAASLFADATLRRVLEVLDRRRPVIQLRALLTPALVDAVTSTLRTSQASQASPSRRTAPATLRRVRLRPAGPDASAAEVFATYTRGGRVRALAARIELSEEAGRWQVVALQIG